MCCKAATAYQFERKNLRDRPSKRLTFLINALLVDHFTFCGVVYSTEDEYIVDLKKASEGIMLVFFYLKSICCVNKVFLFFPVKRFKSCRSKIFECVSGSRGRIEVRPNM